MIKRLVLIALAFAVFGAGYFLREPLFARAAFFVVRTNFVDVRVGDAAARIYLPASYRPGQKGLNANLYLHGNGKSHSTFLGFEALKQIRDGGEIVAIIDGQDQIAPPFVTTASGWGNLTYRRRYIQLYAYLRETYAIDEKVDLIAASMGGLAMGKLIIDQPFPIGRAYGVGPVPSLQTVFDRGGDRRRFAIRNAFGLDPLGKDDKLLSRAASDAFWIDNLDLAKGKLPPLKIVAGTGDSTFKVEFGGTEAYQRLCNRYRQRGGECSYSEVEGVEHSHYDILPEVLAEALVNPSAQ